MWLDARVLYQNNKRVLQKCSKNWNVNWNAEDLSLNPESYVDVNLHVLVKRAYQENWSLLSDWLKDCNLSLISLICWCWTRVANSLLIDREKAFGEPYK